MSSSKNFSTNWTTSKISVKHYVMNKRGAFLALGDNHREYQRK